MAHSFCPVCFDGGRKKLIKEIEKKGIFDGDCMIITEKDWKKIKKVR